MARVWPQGCSNALGTRVPYSSVSVPRHRGVPWEMIRFAVEGWKIWHFCLVVCCLIFLISNICHGPQRLYVIVSNQFYNHITDGFTLWTLYWREDLNCQLIRKGKQLFWLPHLYMNCVMMGFGFCVMMSLDFSLTGISMTWNSICLVHQLVKLYIW